MIPGRKIVTAVVGVISLFTLACTGQMRALRQGEGQLAEMQRIKAELADTYLISLEDAKEPSEAANPLGNAARARVRQLLSRFVELSDGVLRLDDRKGIAVTGRAGIERERERAKALIERNAAEAGAS